VEKCQIEEGESSSEGERGMLVEMLEKVNFKNRNALSPNRTSRWLGCIARAGWFGNLTAATHWFVLWLRPSLKDPTCRPRISIR
jgi:hypothetical protein